MISIDDFRRFLGFSTRDTPGQKAVGILKVSRADQSSTNIINIPAQEWSAQGTGKTFDSTESRIINQSQKHIEIGIQARLVGASYNLAAGQNWGIMDGILVTNENPISGGKDVIKGQAGMFPDNADLGPADSRLQACIDLGKDFARRIIGLKPTEDLDETNILIRECVFLIGMFRLQQNTSQGYSVPIPSGQPVSKQSEVYFRHQIYQPLIRQCQGILSPLIKIGRHINGEAESA